MIEQVSNAITFYAQFLVSGAGAEGLTITCTVKKGSDGSAVATAQAATELFGGLYKYTVAGGLTGAEDDYLAVFNEQADTADQTDVPAMWAMGRAGVENLDANVAGVETKVDTAIADVGSLDTKHDATDVALAVVDGNVGDIEGKVDALPAAAAVADQVWDEALAGHAAAGSAGTALAAAGGASDPLLNSVPGAYAQGTAGYALGRIGSGRVTAVQPVSGDPPLLILVRGDDYHADDGRAISFSSEAWPDITEVTEVRITVRRRPQAFRGSGTDDLLFTATDDAAGRQLGGATQVIRFNLVAADTAELLVGAGAGKYDVQATVGGNVVTLVTGLVTVVEDQTR